MRTPPSTGATFAVLICSKANVGFAAAGFWLLFPPRPSAAAGGAGGGAVDTTRQYTVSCFCVVFDGSMLRMKGTYCWFCDDFRMSWRTHDNERSFGAAPVFAGSSSA